MNCPNCNQPCGRDLHEEHLHDETTISFGPWTCFACGWYEGWEADREVETEQEQLGKVDAACEELERVLAKPSGDSIRLVAGYDQIRAACRDSAEVRQKVIDTLVEDGCTREDAIEWVDKREEVDDGEPS